MNTTGRHGLSMFEPSIFHFSFWNEVDYYRDLETFLIYCEKKFKLRDPIFNLMENLSYGSKYHGKNSLWNNISCDIMMKFCESLWDEYEKSKDDKDFPLMKFLLKPFPPIRGESRMNLNLFI